MLSPKKTKYRKQFKGRIHGMSKGGFALNFGSHGLKSVEPERITARQIEAGRVAAQHFMRREGRLFIRIFPHKPVSAKPLEVRMGTGKGEPEYWCAIVKEGTMMFEVTGVDEVTAKRALARVAHKMPIPCRFVPRRHAVA